MEHQYQYLDIKIPVKEPENGLLDVVKIIRPSWDKDQLDIKVMHPIYYTHKYNTLRYTRISPEII